MIGMLWDTGIDDRTVINVTEPNRNGRFYSREIFDNALAEYRDALYGSEVEEELTHALATEIQSEIDAELINRIIDISSHIHSYHNNDILPDELFDIEK